MIAVAALVQSRYYLYLQCDKTVKELVTSQVLYTKQQECEVACIGGAVDDDMGSMASLLSPEVTAHGSSGT